MGKFSKSGANPHNQLSIELSRAQQQKNRRRRRRKPATVLLQPAEYVPETRLIKKPS